MWPQTMETGTNRAPCGKSANEPHFTIDFWLFPTVIVRISRLTIHSTFVLWGAIEKAVRLEGKGSRDMKVKKRNGRGELKEKWVVMKTTKKNSTRRKRNSRSVENWVFKGNGDSHQPHIDGRSIKNMIGTRTIDYPAFSDHIVQDGRVTSATITLETSGFRSYSSSCGSRFRWMPKLRPSRATEN
jgi:hypothetical protein